MESTVSAISGSLPEKELLASVTVCAVAPPCIVSTTKLDDVGYPFAKETKVSPLWSATSGTRLSRETVSPDEIVRNPASDPSAPSFP